MEKYFGSKSSRIGIRSVALLIIINLSNLISSVVDRHRFDADPHIHVGKLEFVKVQWQKGTFCDLHTGKGHQFSWNLSGS